MLNKSLIGCLTRMLLGFDFDNTLIRYDKLFHRIALGKALIPEGTLRSKNTIRDYLRKQGQEEEWTRLQGEVYGGRILEAEAFPDMKEVMKWFVSRNIPMCIVSHKTRTPYLGKPWDLHAAARSWLAIQGFNDFGELGLSKKRIFFEITKEAKITRICELGCTHYVDDLPEILEMLPDCVEKILFAPNGDPGTHNWKLMRTWQELPALIGLR